MSAKIQKILSLAVGMDSTEFNCEIRTVYSELGKAKTAATAEQQEIVQNRLILQSAKRG